MRGIVTLCGSVRFKDTFELVNKELTLHKWIVLAPGVFEHESLHNGTIGALQTKSNLDKLHREKIDLSDSIVVINVDGYIGQSTEKEIEYATDRGKMVFWFYLPSYVLLEASWREMVT